MATLDAVNAAVADLTQKVAAATSLDASVATLVKAQVDQLKALSDEIAALQADHVTQEQINAVAQGVAAQAAALDQGTAGLQAAVPANTPAA